jgi:hypothetical protein
MQPVLMPLVCDPPTQPGVSAVPTRKIAVPVDFAIVCKFSQTVLPRTSGKVAAPFKTKAFQCLDTGKSHRRCLSFQVQAVLLPLVSDPPTQVFAVLLRNITVPADFAIVGKFTQTVLPGTGGAPAAPFKTEALQCLDTGKSYLRCLSF